MSPAAELALSRPIADPDLFRPAPGWTGPIPQTQRDLALAAEAEIAGRTMCNAQLEALGDIYMPPDFRR